LGAADNNASEAGARIRENGQIMLIYVNRGRPPEVHTPGLEEAVLEAMENASGRSIRGLAREFQVDYRTIQSILADEHYHPLSLY
jgi:hypothetical protein